SPAILPPDYRNRSERTFDFDRPYCARVASRQERYDVGDRADRASARSTRRRRGQFAATCPCLAPTDTSAAVRFGLDRSGAARLRGVGPARARTFHRCSPNGSCYLIRGRKELTETATHAIPSRCPLLQLR